MSDHPNSSSLPRRTAKYIIEPDQMTEAGIRGMISNPIYVGVPPYERVVSDEVWVRSAVKLIEEEGPEQFLVNMLYMLRNSMVDVVPDEAIPPSYDGPWPEDEEDEDEAEDLPFAFEDSSPPSPWHHPLEGFIYCSHEGSPMIIIDEEFVCVSEYLYAHLDNSPVTDLIAEPVLTLIFRNGHTLPLLCPDCGQSLHVDDHNELLDELDGLIVAVATWNDESEELVVEFGQPEDVDSLDEPEEILMIHLDSVRGLTCPNKQIWDDEVEE